MFGRRRNKHPVLVDTNKNLEFGKAHGRIYSVHGFHIMKCARTEIIPAHERAATNDLSPQSQFSATASLTFHMPRIRTWHSIVNASMAI